MAIKDLPGLGPRSAQMLASIGIDSEEQFFAADPFKIYQQLHANGTKVSLNLLYALIGAQQNQHWQVIKQNQRMEILMRLDDMGLAPK